MARALFALLLALLVSTIVAVPTKQLRKRTFKIHRVENPAYVADGRMAMKRAYAKFGLGDIESKPDSDVRARVNAAKTSTGTEDGGTSALGTQNDAQFLSPITVGGQQIVVNLDTGSADFWLLNTKTQGADPQKHTLYDQTKSRTFQTSTSKFAITYGDGSTASGPIGFDTVDIGGTTVERQAIGLPTQVSEFFLNVSRSNGLIGLAFSKLNTAGQKTFFANVLPDLSEPVFTAQLKGGTVGAYEFGAVDKKAFKGELAEVDIDNSRGFWQFKSNKMVVKGVETAIKGNAIADTGTSLMLVDDDMLRAYWGQVAESEFDKDVPAYLFPCKTKLPDLQVAAGSHMTTVAGTNLNYAFFETRVNPSTNQTVDSKSKTVYSELDTC